ncbi:MAG: PEP-CTERM sorting domain-containing protein [Armatimonadota bacterium]
MRRLFGIFVVALVLMSFAIVACGQTLQPVTLQQSISLARITNRGTSFLANDFHIKIKADSQHFNANGSYYWAATKLMDFSTNGYYCSGTPTQTTFTTWEEDGWIHLYWTFPEQWINVNNGMMFGFTNYGGIKFNNVQWWWTFNGQDVRDLPDNWQDWYKDNNGMLVDVIANRTTSPLQVDRLTGTTTSRMTISEIAALTTPPNPVVPPINPVVVGPSQTLEYAWNWPGEDPIHFMWYDFEDGYGDFIEFRNAAYLDSVPEPSSIFALAAGLMSFIGIRRRRA